MVCAACSAPSASVGRPVLQIEVGQRQSGLERLSKGADGALEGRFPPRCGCRRPSARRRGWCTAPPWDRRRVLPSARRLRPRSSRARRARWPAARWRPPASAPSPAPCRRAHAPARTGGPGAAAGRRGTCRSTSSGMESAARTSSRRPPCPVARLDQSHQSDAAAPRPVPDPCRRRCGTRAPPRAPCPPSRSRRRRRGAAARRGCSQRRRGRG